ncbi:hypothetical protein CVT24_009426 [Panaeolus cyanescens]|uniref:Hemerythrin-like domain-containing protein n=1 Tax=Panaeolus cyanescens TaxID=181874 RepID=A0A409VER7_9AGAR|nr:hypothetical protein CVT24_009426 [Panaeolus cyanescens]
MDTDQAEIEMKQWNRLADRMDMFHNMFKDDFNQLYDLADGSFDKLGLGLSGYLQLAQSLINHLTLHHNLEERYIFPSLGEYLPQFSKSVNGAHLQSHHDIHEGLESLGSLVKKWSKDPSHYSPNEMRQCLDGFREVLFHHLDEEVRDLQGENLMKYMTLQDVNRITV